MGNYVVTDQSIKRFRKHGAHKRLMSSVVSSIDILHMIQLEGVRAAYGQIDVHSK